MNNTMQLYIDDNNEVKGYPITTPDRVIDENGVSVKKRLKNNVKFDIVGKGEGIPEIDGKYDDTEIRQDIKNIDTEISDARNGEEKLGNLIRKLNDQLDTINNECVRLDIKYKDLINGNDYTNALQQAMINDSCIIIPNKQIEISDTIEIMALRRKPLIVKGSGYSSEIIFTNTEENKNLFWIRQATNWGYREKLFSNIKITANKAKNQSIFRYFLESVPYTFGDNGLQIDNCYLNTSGYVMEYTNSAWCGNSFIKNSEIVGNGIIKAIPKYKDGWISKLYPHSFSNFVLEDVHYSGTTKRNGPVIHMSGSHNFRFTNLVLEGHLNSMDDNDYTGARVIHLEDSFGTIQNIWVETTTKTNALNSKHMIFNRHKESVSSFIPGITIDGGIFGIVYESDTVLIGEENNKNGLSVNIRNIGFYNDMEKYINVYDGNMLFYEKCIFSKYDKISTKNIKYINSMSFSHSYSNNSVGSIHHLNKHDEQVILYKYTGGNLGNGYVKGVAVGESYPHKNSSGQNTCLIKNKNGTFRLDLSEFQVLEKANLKVSVKTLIQYIGHHSNSEDDKKIKTIHSINNLNLNANGAFSIYNILLDIPNINKFAWIEIVKMVIYIGDTVPYLENISRTTSTNSLLDLYNNPTTKELYGTFETGDRIFNSKPNNTNRKWLCKSVMYQGTSRDITGISCTVNSTDLKKVYIENLEDFKKILPGDYIQFNNNSARNKVIDYIYDTKNGNYLIMTNNIGAGTYTISEQPPVFLESSFS